MSLIQCDVYACAKHGWNLLRDSCLRRSRCFWGPAHTAVTAALFSPAAHPPRKGSSFLEEWKDSGFRMENPGRIVGSVAP